jgi:hypothetical protein
MQGFLVSHPNISIPAVGSNMWTYFYRRYGDLSQRNNFERCLTAMLDYKHVAFLSPDPDRIRREFRQGEPTYGRLFALFQMHHAELEGKPRWGVQTELIERYADLIFRAYPKAKMIHMIRDPRDRYAAAKARKRGSIGGATARWLYSVGLARRNLQRYPGQYKLIRYETLVCQPEATLRAVCTFLKEEYTPTMLNMHGSLVHRDKLCVGSRVKPGECPLSTHFIGRFRQVLSKREIAFMQAYGEQDMLAHSYPLEPMDQTIIDWLLLYFIDVPKNTARLLTWRILERLQQRFPAQIGRKPPPRMVSPAWREVYGQS